MRCPEGSHVRNEDHTLGAGDYLMADEDRGGQGSPTDQADEAMVRALLNRTQMDFLRIEACVVGRTDPKKHGPAVFWTKVGNRRVADAFFRNGQKHGQWRWWEHDGHLSERVEYQEDARHGRRVRWDSQGRPRSLETYDRGRLHGPLASWWPNGS